MERNEKEAGQMTKKPERKSIKARKKKEGKKSRESRRKEVREAKRKRHGVNTWREDVMKGGVYTGQKRENR